MTEEQLSQASIDYVKNAPLAKRKELGQYMTPRTISDIVLKHLPIKDGDKVLDPAVGTGELLAAVTRQNPNVTCYGWDIDEEILSIAEKSFPNFIFTNRSAIDTLPENELNKYDVIIANPPYFEMKLSPEQKIQFKEIVSGRANIFALFFQQAIKLTKDGGYIGFIVPPSLNAGAFFKNLRSYILTHTEIVHLELIRKSSHFIDAQTAVQVIVMRKTYQPTTNKTHVFSLKTPTGETTVLTEDSQMLEKNWKNKTSLYDLGYVAITGTIPWNEFKDELSEARTTSNSVPLIYAKDISNINTIKLNPALASRRYLTTNNKAPIHEEAILVNRIVGSLESPSLRVAKFGGKTHSFFAENHVNVILPHNDFTPKISLDELYNRIITDKELVDYIKALTGNTQISAKELSYLIPL